MGKDVWWVSNGLICSVYDGRQEHLITLITIPTGGQWGPVSRRMSSLQHLSCFICGKEIGKRPPVLPDWHCVQGKESGVTMWRGRYSVLTTFSSVATLGLTKPALSAAAQSLTNWSRSPPGTPSLSVSSLYCRQSQDTTTHTASNVNSARSRWPARSTLWTKTTRYQLCLTLSLSPLSLSQVYCLEDFCYLFGPKCGRCKKTIYPVENTAILIRVKASSAQAGVSWERQLNCRPLTETSMWNVLCVRVAGVGFQMTRTPGRIY